MASSSEGFSRMDLRDDYLNLFSGLIRSTSFSAFLFCLGQLCLLRRLRGCVPFLPKHQKNAPNPYGSINAGN